MLPFYKYVNVPKVPKHLIESFESIEQRVSQVPKTKTTDKYFNIVPVRSDLEAWTNIFFQFPKHVFYSVFYGCIPMHSDLSRISSYNYILQSGGDVKTKYQNENIEIVEEMPIEKWYWIDTSLKHGTVGTPSCNRIILMVTPLDAVIK